MKELAVFQMIAAFWNIRGFHLPLKQKGVEALIRKRDIGIVAVLETKLSLNGLEVLMRRRFKGWNQVNNFQAHAGGRILILFDPKRIRLETLEIKPQVIHCKVFCMVSSTSFLCSFVYAFNSIGARRGLWDELKEWGGFLG